MPSALGLSTYRWNNNLKSMLLLMAFPFLLLALLGSIFWLYGFFSMSGQGQLNPEIAALISPNAVNQLAASPTPLTLAFLAIYQFWPIVLGIALVWTLIGYFFNDSIIHLATGAREATRQDQPRLYKILENLCIERGLKTPKLYVIDTEGMNAYASGIDEKSYAVTVTSGLLNQLNDQEVEAVLGHELTHIINRDCRLLIITVVFVGMISFMSQLLWRNLRFVSIGRDRNSRSGGGVLLLMLIAAFALFVGYLLALVLRFALSRRREYLADAGSVELTKNPEALISALKKIAENASVPHVPSEVQQMFIENPPSFFDGGGLFATHPPIAKRIAVLVQLSGASPPGHSVIPKSQ